MWNVLTAIWNGIINFLAILLPFSKGSTGWTMKPGMRRGLQIALLILILIILFILNSLFFKRDVNSSWAQYIWLPLAFLLVYLLVWTGWWIWKLLRAEPEASTFPDIDAAWEAAVRGLAQAGFRLTDWPLFLVLGRPQEAEEILFSSLQTPLAVKQTPPGPVEPLHVYATRSAIYVTCAGASLLGKHAANLALEGVLDQAGEQAAVDTETSDENKTIVPTGSEKKIIRQLARTHNRPMTSVERRAARRELGLPVSDLLKKPAEVEMLRARLAHLCRLVVRDRMPLCPINGLLVLVPIGGTDTDHDAQQTADICLRDLSTARAILKLQCPMLVLCCDVETLPGFTEFIQRVSARQRLGRLGQKFPLASPDLAGEALQEQIDKSIHFMCNNYMRDWVYGLFKADPAAGETDFSTNANLYLFLDEMRSRKKNLSRILTQGIAKDGPVPLLYAGCYLAGTGVNKDKDQAFIAGVIQRLEDHQSQVSWTDQALAEDRNYHGRARFGYALLAAVILIPVAILVFLYIRGK